MKSLGLLIAVSVLTSCASVGELRERPPMFDVQSSKTVNQAAGCVSAIWSRQRGATVNTMVIENGLVVSIGWMHYSNPVTELVFEVKDEGEYRRAKLISRSKTVKQKDVDIYRESLRYCL